MPDVDTQTRKMIDSLPEKTGKSLDQWLTLLAPMKAEKHSAIVKELKGKHGVTHGYANLISHAVRSSAAAFQEDDLVAAQYADKKAGLRPIYDKLAAAVGKFGPDIEFAPKKAYVSLRRSKQFGLIQPSTSTRVDVGIKLKSRPPAGRLEASGSWNAMVTHRVRIGSADEVDEEVIGWLREAYEEA